MNPVVGQFEPLDAQLMLLAADELPVAEAQALRERIQADPALAARFAALAEEFAGLETLLAAADRARPVSRTSERVAQNEACRAVRAWLERDVPAASRVVAPSPIETAVWRYARWPLAAAAAVVVGLILLPSILDSSDQRGSRADGRFGGTYSEGRGSGFEGFPKLRGRERGPIEGWGSPPGGNMPDGSEADSEEWLTSLFENPTVPWETDGDELSGFDFQSDLRDELATVQALGDAWSDDGF